MPGALAMLSGKTLNQLSGLREQRQVNAFRRARWSSEMPPYLLGGEGENRRKQAHQGVGQTVESRLGAAPRAAIEERRCKGGP